MRVGEFALVRWRAGEEGVRGMVRLLGCRIDVVRCPSVTRYLDALD